MTSKQTRERRALTLNINLIIIHTWPYIRTQHAFIVVLKVSPVFFEKSFDYCLKQRGFLNLNVASWLIIYSRNAKMRTFQSLLSQLNLKHLLLTLRQIKSRPTLPFYVLRIHPSPFLNFDDCALSINKKLSNSTLQMHQGPLAAWSTHHLHRITQTFGNKLQKRVILKNPFKSEQLLWEALTMGVQEMAVSTQEELLRIQNFKNRNFQFKHNPMKYFWIIEDHPQNIKELQSVQQFVKGLFFQAENRFTNIRVDQITTKVLLKGAQINEIIREGSIQELSDLKEWKREQLEWRTSKIKKTIDLCDLSEVENFILVTRSLSQKKLAINEEAKKLLEGIDPYQNSLLVDYEKEQWLFSALAEFPMNQQKFMFEVETESERIGKVLTPAIY